MVELGKTPINETQLERTVSRAFDISRVVPRLTLRRARSNMMFAGLTSLWMIPLEWTKSNACPSSSASMEHDLAKGGTHPQELKEVVFDLHLGQRAEQLLPVRVRYILHDEAVRARRAVMDGVHKADDVRASGEIAQDLDLALYLLLRDGLQHLDDA